MWKLTKISSENIVSFRDMDFEINQGHATLIFGQNNDSDKQKNNGSGKSSFVEAVSFGITGEPLRKVNTDEIINDFADSAWVDLYFENDETELVVRRVISRAHGQSVECMTKVKGSDKFEVIPQPSVNDCNKFILETLGFSKNELYSSYILCANKYKSFFRVSDREKKEIINKFSNGILVDEGIAKLMEDIEPVQKEANDRALDFSMADGKLKAIEEQIEEAEKDSENRKIEKEEKIKSLNVRIREKENEIVHARESIRNSKDRYNSIVDFEDKLVDIEGGDDSVEDAFSYIKENSERLDVPVSDYNQKLQMHKKSLSEVSQKCKAVKILIKDAKRKADEANKAYVAAVDYKDRAIKRDKELSDVENAKSLELFKMESEVSKKTDEINDRLRELYKENMACSSKITDLQNILHGVITCPKCSHQFLLNADMDLDDVRDELVTNEKLKSKIDSEETSLKNEVISLKESISGNEKERAELLRKQSERADILSKCHRKMVAARNAYDFAETELQKIERESDALSEKAKKINEKISNLRGEMFDEIFNSINTCADNELSAIKRNEELIAALNASIETYRKSIDELRTSSDDAILASLVASKERYARECADVSERLNETMERLNTLRKQEHDFIEFKSYLANTKIEAISQITNSFLEKIGSDLWLELSGYKMLKSGKLRENITVRVLRNGIDCGSFDKLSGGERARVMLANILAMHSLTNVNCDNGKGLDLLIIDEVLDCSDESGIASYCDVFNTLGVTSMIITQGLVSESYPYKLLVVKENGVSTIINK